MTLVNIDIKNVASETHPDDRVVFYSPTLREAPGGGITSTAETVVPLVDGVGEIELVPGPVTVTFQCRGISDTRPKSGTVPDAGPVDIADVIGESFTYAPPVVNRGLDLIEGARDEALGLVDGAVDEALDSRVVPLEGLRAVLRRSLGMANKASKKLTTLERDFSQIQEEVAGAADSRSLTLRALHASATARKNVLALAGQLNDKPSREEMLQAIAGLTHDLSTMEARLNTKINAKADK